MDYRYQLAPYSGKGSRFICPNCGQRELVPYIDTETGEILDETCGKCNRLSRCGYHKTPSQYFQENPGARPQGESWREAPNWLKQKPQPKKTLPLKPKVDGPICQLPVDLVERSFPWAPKSDLVRFLETILDPMIVEQLIDLYKLGGTKDGDTIYYQIDRQGRFRSGKIIPYNAETGKRVKDGETNAVNWLHSVLARPKYLPVNWTMTQCLFGEHLLDMYPDQPVCLVEAEKSAVICAGFMPEFVWVATGGKTQLGDKLNVLKGREVIAFPDIDAIDYWREYFEKFEGADINVEDVFGEYATDEDRENQVDIADWLIREAQSDSVPSVPTRPTQIGMGKQPEGFRSRVMLQVAKYFSPEYYAEIEALIEEFDLVPVSVQQIEPTENDSFN